MTPERATLSPIYRPYEAGVSHGSGGQGPTLSSTFKSLSTAIPTVDGLSGEKRQTLASMIKVIRPRDEDADMDHWYNQIRDVFRDRRFDDVFEQERPTLALVQARYPEFSEHDMSLIYRAAVDEYDTRNDDIFAIVKLSLDLTGPFYRIDTKVIEGLAIGRMRDGNRLIKWVLQHRERQDLKGQAEIATELVKYNSDSGRINANASLSQIALHNDAFTELWLQYIPNTDIRLKEPQAYAKALLGTYPDKPNDAPVVYLRRWLAEQITNVHPVTTGDPADLQRMMLVHGANLGIAEGKTKSGAILKVGGKGNDKLVKENKCSRCPAWGCMETNGKCLVFMDPDASTKIVASMIKQGKLNSGTVIDTCRTYAKAHNLTSVKNVNLGKMRAWVKDCKVKNKTLDKVNPIGAPSDAETGVNSEANGASPAQGGASNGAVQAIFTVRHFDEQLDLGNTESYESWIDPTTDRAASQKVSTIGTESGLCVPDGFDATLDDSIHDVLRGNRFQVLRSCVLMVQDQAEDA